MPREPMASGNRAPVDSPMTRTGARARSRCASWCATFLLLVALVEAPLMVKSFTTSATSRPPILP